MYHPSEGILRSQCWKEAGLRVQVCLTPAPMLSAAETELGVATAGCDLGSHLFLGGSHLMALSPQWVITTQRILERPALG